MGLTETAGRGWCRGVRVVVACAAAAGLLAVAGCSNPSDFAGAGSVRDTRQDDPPAFFIERQPEEDRMVDPQRVGVRISSVPESVRIEPNAINPSQATTIRILFSRTAGDLDTDVGSVKLSYQVVSSAVNLNVLGALEGTITEASGGLGSIPAAANERRSLRVAVRARDANALDEALKDGKPIVIRVTVSDADGNKKVSQQFQIVRSYEAEVIDGNN